jgi:hypothetical protein
MTSSGCEGANVTYRWRDGKTGQIRLRTVSGATFGDALGRQSAGTAIGNRQHKASRRNDGCKVEESIATIGCALTISVSLAQMFPGPQHRRC